MKFLLMIWDGLSGLGSGTVILKALFIIFLGAVFWMLCDLVKYIVRILSKLGVDALRHLAIVIRGWPKNSGESEEGREGSPWDRANKGSR